MEKNIIVPAWEMVSAESILKKFNFLPSLLSTIYLSGIILYQVAFTYIYVFQLKDEFFSWVLDFVHSGYFEEVVVTIVSLLVVYIIFTPLAEAGLVALIDAITHKKERMIRVSFGLSRGLQNFLPIFEFHNAMGIFKLLSIITFYIFLLRVFGMAYIFEITAIMGVYLLFAFVVNIMLAYTRYFIIFDGLKAFEAMSASVRMALDNMDVTFKLYFTLLLVYFRTIFTAGLLIVLPFVVSAILTFVSMPLFKMVSIGVLSIIVLGLYVFIAHLNSVLEIFVETIWYNAFMENKANGDYSGHDDHGHDDHWHGGHDAAGHGDSHGHSSGHDDHWHH